MKLYHFPRACSRVTMTALEEAGFTYEDQVVNILKGKQKHPDYLAVHRSGKVPALAVDEGVLTENAAIIAYLNSQAPEAELLPPTQSDLVRSQQFADLAWCSGTLHPTMRQIRMPIRFTDGDASGVKAKGHELLADMADHVNQRVADGWWYGERWSIVDVYLTWIFSTGVLGGFDLSPYTELQRLIENVTARDSFQRALAREAQAEANAGIEYPPS